MHGRQFKTTSYQEYQSGNPRYGFQYSEPGGHAEQAQQRSNMTQREDVVKFEQGRIKILQEERLHIQKKTFTKWMNSFLQKARMEVDDLFVDLADGRKLLKLLEIISGEKLARPNNGKMRVHKIENVNKSLAFLHTKVRLESIGAEDIVDGNRRLILGLIWTIILRFQIQEIEIDVDEENESSEKKSAKDALLLWCQRKTNGYQGVHISNFTDSWRTGLGFNALIHSHRPDLFDYNKLHANSNMDNLNHAFEVANAQLGIPKLLDAEDVDTSRPDEKSVITYVVSYYHTFARMKNEQKIGKRIANYIGQLMDSDGKKLQYSRIVTDLLEWIELKIQELGDRSFPNTLDGIQKLLLDFKQYRTVEKPPKYKERVEIEALFFHINTVAQSLWRKVFIPAEWQKPVELEKAWRKLEAAEHQREVALRDELLRQQRLEHLHYKFNTKAVLRKGYLKEMIQVLSDPRYGSNVSQVDATVKKHEAISADILARQERFEDLKAMAEELVKENYHGAETVKSTEKGVLASWNELLNLLRHHQEALAALSALMALLREVDTAFSSIAQLRSQLVSDDVGPHLIGVEEAAQQLALQELQLGALGETKRKLTRQCAGLPQSTIPSHEPPRKLLEQRIEQLQNEYDELEKAAKERKARLDNARNLYQFIEDHEEEEGWVTERQRICQAGITAKDLRAVLSLQQKHTALGHEIRARERHTAKVTSKGNSLIEEKHPKSADIKRRLESLENHWQQLRELADLREKQLREAAEAYQFYADANESESWLKEKLSLVSSSDMGNDEPSAQALLSRHKVLQGELAAYKPELNTLNTQADRLIAQGIDSIQLTSGADETNLDVDADEWVNETRLVPTEVWDEEPVERLEHKTVTEDRSIPQVKALYPFTGQGMTMAKGEVMFLINKTNPDWWSVRKADGTDGFIPANYVREVEPRIVPVQVRKAEKVRTTQRVKKTILTKQTVRVRQPGRKRPVQRLRKPSTRPEDSVDSRRNHINEEYENLLQLAIERHAALEDAIRLYAFYGDCDDLERWIKDKEKLLKTEDPTDTVDSAKRKYEKFVTDLSATTSRLTKIDSAVQELAKQRHPQLEKATARAGVLHRLWDNLNRLKAQKEKSLEGASSVELFERTCEEAKEWTQEKSRQLEADELGTDLHTVRALQRRHAQLERELTPLKEKVEKVHLLAESVKSSYPSERANVNARQKEIQQLWEECEEKARDKRARLENAVGHQIFNRSSTSLLSWLHDVKEQLAAEVKAKDVATAEAYIKQHNELLDDINAHRDELNEVIELGEKLVKNNPRLVEVAEKVEALKSGKKTIDDEWKKKDALLKECLQLQFFNREADRIDASTGAHEAFLEFQDLGDSVEAVEALIKRHEDFENMLNVQDERLREFCNTGKNLVKKKHYATEQIIPRVEQVLNRRESVKLLTADRRRQLHASAAYHHFCSEANDLDDFIQDKMRTATDQSYKDLSNLERKLQKHEAFERELHANEAQLRNVTNTGESLITTDPAKKHAVTSRLKELRDKWMVLRQAAADRGRGLRQASAQRDHAVAAQDARDRLASLKRSLEGQVTARDLRTCKNLLNQHQALELEISQWRQRVQELQLTGADLAAENHFDAKNVQAESQLTVQALEDLAEPMAKRRALLEEGLKFHKFKFSLDAELQWVSEHMGAAASEAVASDLHAAQGLHKKHKKLLTEIAGHKPSVDRTLANGAELISQGIPDKDKIGVLCEELQDSWEKLEAAGATRGTKLEQSLKAQQFLQDALDVESWIESHRVALSAADYGRDREHAMQLLTKHKALELELDTYIAIVSEMGHSAQGMASAGYLDAPILLEKHAQLTQSLRELQKLVALRQKALVESLCRHEYLIESVGLEQWIQEQLVAASSEDYGQDYEHLLILKSKFEELRHRVEAGEERFNQCDELAKKLVMSESPYIPEIEKTQEELGEAWQKLINQIDQRATRLGAASDIHRYHRDAAEALERLQDKRAIIPDEAENTKDLNAAMTLLRRHEGLENDLLALEAQLQLLSEDATRLQVQYPGNNAAHIAKQQKELDKGWEALRKAAAERRECLHAACDLHRFLVQVRDLTSWSSGLRASMRAEVPVRDVNGAQALRTEHEAILAEIEARDDSFRTVLDMGQAMVQTGHRSATEVEGKCTGLLEERTKLHTAWKSRLVELDQLTDLQFFLRDAKQLDQLCQTHEVALGSYEISPSSSVEEVDTQLKKHDAFEKLLNTQEEKVATLNNHGSKLLQQNHPNSQIISQGLQAVNERRRKVRELCSQKRDMLDDALLHAQFSRDVAETQFWIQDKMKKLDADQVGEVTNLEDKIKKLQKHQAFKAELVANEGRMSELKDMAKRLIERKGRAQSGPVKESMDNLQRDWMELLHRADQTGRGLEEAQDILEFNNQVDKIEAWIRHKEMMVQAADTGKDYEHCSALLRKLDDLDSDMRVDDKHIRKISALADKLLQEGQTSGPAVAERRDAFLNKWRALSGALHQYRNNLTEALEIHQYNRDVQDTIERAAEKAALLNSGETVKDLRGVERLQRRRDALHRDATAVQQKIDIHEKDAKTLISKYPEQEKAINGKLNELKQSWKQLQEQLENRRKQLDDAYSVHKFDTELKDLDVWVNEAVKHMENVDSPANVLKAEELLELHQERKAEVDNRQKIIEFLQKEAENLPLPVQEDITERPKRIADLSNSLHTAWDSKKVYLTQAHGLQLFKEQARQTENWLSAKEAFLNNDDLGDSLPAVEALLKKHAEFNKLLSAQQAAKTDELKKFGQVLLEGDHYDKHYIKKRLDAVDARLLKLKQTSETRGNTLQQSLELQQFLQNLHHEHEWIALKSQVVGDQNYKDLSNLQSKIQRHAAFESELLANKDRIHAVVGSGENLIKKKHYAASEIEQHVLGLENDWSTLQEASEYRRKRLDAAYQARVFLRNLDDFTSWMDDVETQLQSDDHGKDLPSVGTLLTRHTRLEQDVSQRGDECTQLRDMALQLEAAGNFMSDEINEKVDSAINRYRQLQEPLTLRRANLEDAQLLHRWSRDADEELHWLQERAPLAAAPSVASSLAHAHNLQKKHNALEVELVAREPIIAGLASRSSQMQHRRHYGREQLEKMTNELQDTFSLVKENVAIRKLKLQDAVDMHMFMAEAAEAESWLSEKRPLLESNEHGRDEDSVHALQRRLEAIQREIGTFDKQANKVENLAKALEARNAEGSAEAVERSTAIKESLDALTLLGAKRQQRLQESDKYFRFVKECEEVNEWINEQTTIAASEEYGTDVEHVETLIQAFDNFVTALGSNEGRVDSIAESGHRLLEERTPEVENVKARINDTRSQWNDLRELANARQEALNGARQVHIFDRTADETMSWIAEKDSTLSSVLSHAGHDAHTIRVLSKKHDSLESDTAAVKTQVGQLRAEANRLGETYPDAKDHVFDKLEETTEALLQLSQKLSFAGEQLRQAGQVQAYFDDFAELLAWISEMLARITAPDLANDVPGAEQLIARHKENKTEIDARQDEFSKFYKTGENLIAQDHFLSKDIEENMSMLRQRAHQLHETWKNRNSVYENHLDCLMFKRDAEMLENWIIDREPQLRDGKLGESVPQVEDLIKKHEDFQNTIEAQQDRFNILKRITLVETAFKKQQDKEAEARQAEKERLERERLEVRRAAERARIEQQRRLEEQTRNHEHHVHQPVDTSPGLNNYPNAQVASPITNQNRQMPQPTTTPTTMTKSNSSAHMFGNLRRVANPVKRAESMKPDAIAEQDNKHSIIKSPGMKDSAKSTKRTPSFNTRRRTQSFRKQRGDPSDLPPVEIEGFLERKHESGCGGKRATVRSWRAYHTVLCGQLLCFFKDEGDFIQSKAASPPVNILNAKCERAEDYTKRKHVFRLRCVDGAEFLFTCESAASLEDWVNKIVFHANLPPSMQLLSYGAQADVEAVKQKLKDGNVSSSSSIASSPEPRTRKHRTQTEILTQHRNSQQSLTSSDLPSTPPTPPRVNVPESPTKQTPPAVPPRLPPPSPIDNNVPQMRHNPDLQMSNGAGRPHSEQYMLNSAVPRNQQMRSSHKPTSNNDFNSAFIRSQQYADNHPPPLPQTLPPTPRRTLQYDHLHHHQHHDGGGGEEWQQHRQRIISSSNNNNRPLSHGSWTDTTTPTAQFYSASEYASSSTGAAESSGESELSVTGTSEKKDKKGGVFNIFKRKKNTHS